MAEVFATIAGIASVIDVALRTCTVLYSSLHYLKHEPELSRQLQQTIQSVESILRNVEDFVAVYRQQQASARLLGCLPDAVNYGVILIKAELDALSTLLPAPSASGQIRRRVKWVLDRKRVVEVRQKLDSHQITLTLALQSFAQRNGIQVDEQLSLRLGRIERQHEDTAKELKEGKERFGAELNDLHRLISAGQSAASEKLDSIHLLVSQMQVDNNHVRSSTVLATPNKDVLLMIQEELQRVKANPDPQLDEIRGKISEIAQRLGSTSDEDRQGNVKPSSEHLTEAGRESMHNHRDLTNSAVLCTPDMTAFSITKRPTKVHGRRIRHWRCSWMFRWTIGTLWVTVSTTTADRRMSTEFRIGASPSSQNTYRVTIEFLPAQSLVQLRGLTLYVQNTQDQRGFSQIRPSLSTFALVPKDSEIIEFSKTNNVDGIRDLFERGLAAPSDRDEGGVTPLMWAAYRGAFEACQLLLEQGSDPLAIEPRGHNSFDFANVGFFSRDKNAQESLLIDKVYVKVVELLLQAESNVIEDSHVSTSTWSFVYEIVLSQTRRSISMDSPYLQRLKEWGFMLDDHDSNSSGLHGWVHYIHKSDIRWSSRNVESTLRIVLDLGADICAVDHWGDGPLHYMFTFSPYDRNNTWSESRLEVATALLKNGADPCALNRDGESVLDYAGYFDQTPIFLQSLVRAGYDIKEVLDEIEWRDWCFNNPDHAFAISTAVDNAEIGLPNGTGLVLRNGVRGEIFED